MNGKPFNKETLSDEQNLLLLATRLTFDTTTVDALQSISSKNINWPEFIKYASYHRVLTLAWANLQKYAPNCKMPRYIRDILRCTYSALKTRNRVLLTELEHVQKKLQNADIPYLPVKGAVLLPLLYKDLGLRYTGDYDFLVHKEDVEKIRVEMNSLGYYEGFFNYQNGLIEAPSRATTVQWRLLGSHMLPFRKYLEHESVDHCKLDFRFAFDDPFDEAPVRAMVDAYARTGCLDPAHVFIHLCVHFYAEAHFEVARELGKDINMIKLCDIREFYLQSMQGYDVSVLFRFMAKYNLVKQVVFTLCILNIVYADGYEDDLLTRFAATQYLDGYSRELYQLNEQRQLYNPDFWVYFFSGNNA